MSPTRGRTTKRSPRDAARQSHDRSTAALPISVDSWKPWALVGRSAELAFVTRAIESPDASGVVLAGAAGVGKTRLAREAASAASAAGWPTVWVHATRAAASIPFGALAHLIPPEAGVGSRDRLGLFQAIDAALAEKADGRQLVLGVDDAHALDPASAALVLHLALGGTAFVLATVRTGAEAPEPITALWKDGLAPRLEIQPLSAAELETLLRVVLGGRVERATNRWLFDATGGNVLLLRELVNAAISSGSLVRSAGVWHWTGEIPQGVTLMELIDARMGSLDPSEREVLEVLAIAGELGVRLLERVCPADTVTVVERKGLVEVHDSGRRVLASLGHPMYGQAVRRSMPDAAGRAHRRRLLEAVEACGSRRNDDLLRVVTWRVEVDGSASVHLLRRAAGEAIRRFDYPLAERLAREALRSGGGLPAAVTLAEAANRQGRFEEAESALADWEDRAGSQPEALTYVVQRFAALHVGLGRSEAAGRFLALAEAYRSDADWRAFIGAIRAMLLCNEERLDEALELAVPIVENPAVDDAVRLRAVLPAALALGLTARTRDALALLDTHLDLAIRHEVDLPEAASYWLLAPRLAALLFEARLEEAERILMPAYDLATAQHDHNRRSEAAMGLGRSALLRGKVVTARGWLLEASRGLRQSDVDGFLPLCLAMLAHCYALAGENAEAESTLQEALASVHAGKAWWRPDLALAEIWIAACGGERSRVEELLRREAERSRSSPSVRAIILHTALRVGCPPDPLASSLSEVAAAGQSPFVDACAQHARAVAAGDGGALEDAAGRFEEMGVTLLAAEAAAQAAGAYQKAGQESAARRCASHSSVLAAACEDAVTPALQPSVALRKLTRREAEVVRLAARGLSNTGIAERLTLSVRTVESHLLRAFAKLGVANRGQLPAYFADNRRQMQ